jgi:hypothetical protein
MYSWISTTSGTLRLYVRTAIDKSAETLEVGKAGYILVFKNRNALATAKLAENNSVQRIL